ncbi:UNVERIFIED_CONTAM: hypothetical protein GTU68_041630 [Idotea baltica]|nr:hypothetical protein [Idotea baltica]
MKNGVVKWFNNAKGYGFILAEEDQSDVFVHYSSIEMNGYKTLKAGQEVSFSAAPGPKGMHVTKLEVPRHIMELQAGLQDNMTDGFTPSEQSVNQISNANRDMYETK